MVATTQNFKLVKVISKVTNTVTCFFEITLVSIQSKEFACLISSFHLLLGNIFTGLFSPFEYSNHCFST